MQSFAFNLLHRFKDLESWVRTLKLAAHPNTTRIRRRVLESSESPGGRREFEGRWAVFDFHTTHVDGQQGRRVYPLPVFFLRAGYSVAMVTNRGFVGNIDRKLKALLLCQPITMIPKLDSFTGLDALLVTQRARTKVPAGFRKQLVIKTSGVFDPSSGDFAFPYTLHPDRLHAGDDLELDRYRAIPRRWRLFFSGACEKRYYDTSWIRRDFEKVPRSRVIEIVGRELAGDLTLDLRSAADLETILKTEHGGFVVTRSTEDAIPIPPDRWLEALAHASVFVAAPGVSYPMCHNIVEAMAVGTVPLTEYPEHFDPPLTHGKNCLAYAGEEGLVSRVREIVETRPEELAVWSRCAADYYDRFLSPRSFVDRIEADPRPTIFVHLKAHERPRRSRSLLDPTTTCG
ncbi:MAG: glycosyltransferase [Thermoanaerobaculales bacterium]